MEGSPTLNTFPPWTVGSYDLKYQQCEDVHGCMVTCDGFKPEFIEITDGDDVEALKDPTKRTATNKLYQDFVQLGSDDRTLHGTLTDQHLSTKGIKKIKISTWNQHQGKENMYWNMYFKNAQLTDSSTIDRDLFEHMKTKGMLIKGYDSQNDKYVIQPSSKLKKPFNRVHCSKLLRKRKLEKNTEEDNDHFMSGTEDEYSDVNEEEIDTLYNKESVEEAHRESIQTKKIRLVEPPVQIQNAINTSAKTLYQAARDKRTYTTQLTSPYDDSLTDEDYADRLIDVSAKIPLFNKFFKEYSKRIFDESNSQVTAGTRLWSMMVHCNTERDMLYKDNESLHRLFKKMVERNK